jgi:hypothetical protein
MDTYEVTKIEDMVADFIREEIDWEVVTKFLVRAGWKIVEVKQLNNGIQEWIDTHCKGKVRNRDTTYVFQNEQDAVWFALKWS